MNYIITNINTKLVSISYGSNRVYLKNHEAHVVPEELISEDIKKKVALKWISCVPLSKVSTSVNFNYEAKPPVIETKDTPPVSVIKEKDTTKVKFESKAPKISKTEKEF